MEKESDLKSVSVVSHIVEQANDVFIEERSNIEAQEAMMNFDCDSIKYYDESIDTLDRFEFSSKPKCLELNMETNDSALAKLFVGQALKLELKSLPSHLTFWEKWHFTGSYCNWFDRHKF